MTFAQTTTRLFVTPQQFDAEEYVVRIVGECVVWEEIDGLRLDMDDEEI